MEGQQFLARRFPFRVGRGARADLSVQDDGVWDEHLEIHFDGNSGFYLQSHSGSLVSLNGANIHRARLRNGDLIGLGSVKARFWLAPATQHCLARGDAMTWVLLGGFTLLELILIYILLG